MKQGSRESKIKTKELNKILPSYLIDEVEDSKHDSDEKKANSSEDNNSVSIISKLIFQNYLYRIILTIQINNQFSRNLHLLIKMKKSKLNLI